MDLINQTLTIVIGLTLGRGKGNRCLGYLNIVSLGFIWNLKLGNWDLASDR